MRNLNLPENKNNSQVKHFKRDLFGPVVVDGIPVDIQEEMTRDRLGIPPHIWHRYSDQLRAKTMAVQSIDNMIKTLERAEELYEQAKKENKPKPTVNSRKGRTPNGTSRKGPPRKRRAR